MPLRCLGHETVPCLRFSSRGSPLARERLEPLADIDPEIFYDFSSTRPRVELDDDLQRQIVWPELRFSAGTIPGDPPPMRTATTLLGAEPQLRWRTFTEQVISVARELEVPRIRILVNKVPATFDRASVGARVAEAYGCEVAAVIPHSDELMQLASEGIFAVRQPDHEVAILYATVADELLSG